jgi:hypothetical protein
MPAGRLDTPVQSGGCDEALESRSSAVLVIGAVGVYGGFPRGADLRAFDPSAMARLETAMWRDCYEKHYPGSPGHTK